MFALAGLGVYGVYMNTTAHTPQTISRLLNKAGIRKGHSYKAGRGRQGNRWSEGFSVRNGYEGLVINYTMNSSTITYDADKRNANLAMIAATLTAAGVAFTHSTVYPGAFVVTK